MPLSHLLVVASNTPLTFDLSHPMLQIMLFVVLHVHRRNEDRRVSEQIVHLLERTLGCLGLDGPEEERIGEVAHDLATESVSSIPDGTGDAYEEVVVFISQLLDGDGSDLANHGVESEASHCGNANSHRPSAGIEDFCWYNPYGDVSSQPCVYIEDHEVIFTYTREVH